MNNYLFRGKVYSFAKELGNGYAVSDNENDMQTHYVRINAERAYEIQHPKTVKVEFSIQEVKQTILQKLDEYDKSSMVNMFMFRGQITWLDRDTRTSIRCTVNTFISRGIDEMTYWVNGLGYTVSCIEMLNLLDEVEMYAYNCFNTTAMHRRAIEAMETIEEIENYDYRAGYPQAVVINEVNYE